MFDWGRFCDFFESITVHCKTKEEAEDFCRQMYEHGIISNLEQAIKNYDRYGSETCYSNTGSYCNKKYYETHGSWEIWEYCVFVLPQSHWYNEMEVIN